MGRYQERADTSAEGRHGGLPLLFGYGRIERVPIMRRRQEARAGSVAAFEFKLLVRFRIFCV